MCIIAIKPAGKPAIERTTLETMFNNNPDGAGIMLPINNKLHVFKGMMSLSALETRLSALSEHVDLSAVPIIYHFRITTHGASSASNTHPFIITKNIKKMSRLESVSNLGMVHNGIIDIEVIGKKISDTMQFVKDVVYPLYSLNREFLKNQDALDLLDRQAGSKLAFMDAHGHVTTVGDFITDTDTGVIYSNTSYLASRWSAGACYSNHYYDDKYGVTDYDDITLDTMRLMSLYNHDMSTTYILYDDGTTDDPSDYYMDRDGSAYVLNWLEGYVIPVSAIVIGTSYDWRQAYDMDINTSLHYDTLDQTIHGIDYMDTNTKGGPAY